MESRMAKKKAASCKAAFEKYILMELLPDAHFIEAPVYKR
jgi:hypothetical protein